MRIAKFLARANLCSRREAERLVLQRLVAINGTILSTCATLVQANDIVTVAGQIIEVERHLPPKLWLFHKPLNTLVTKRDPQNRRTIFHLLPAHLSHLRYIGRLDRQTSGLLLLTDFGEVSRYFELPRNGIKRVYRVTYRGKLSKKHLDLAQKGVKIDGIRYGSAAILPQKTTLQGGVAQIALHEGKNREVRNIMSHFKLQVTHLCRVQYGDYMLNQVPKPGDLQQVENFSFDTNQSRPHNPCNIDT